MSILRGRSAKDVARSGHFMPRSIVTKDARSCGGHRLAPHARFSCVCFPSLWISNQTRSVQGQYGVDFVILSRGGDIPHCVVRCALDRRGLNFFIFTKRSFSAIVILPLTLGFRHYTYSWSLLIGSDRHEVRIFRSRGTPTPPYCRTSSFPMLHPRGFCSHASVLLPHHDKIVGCPCLDHFTRSFRWAPVTNSVITRRPL